MQNLIKITSISVIILALSGIAYAGNYVKISDDVQLYYEEAGKGTPLIFIPGWTMTTEFYKKQLAYFQKKYRVIVYDPRSHGRSSRTIENNNYIQHGKDLKALMAALDLKEAILVSWSWGVLGHLAYFRTAGYEGIKASIFIDGSPRPQKTKDDEWGSGTAAQCYWWADQAQHDRHGLNKIFAEWMLEKPTPEHMDWIADQSLRTPNYAAALLAADATFADYTKEAKTIDEKMPVLYVLREDIGKIATEWIRANTPNAEILVLGKHMMFWDRPDEFNSRVDVFLGRVK